jgi:two-component system phosphate regulon sensor histidine kinase PhoR
MATPDLAYQDPIEKIILRSLKEGVITVECSGRIHTVNPAALQLLGLPDGNFEGRDCRDVFSDPQNTEFNSLVVKLVRKATETLHEETRYTRPDGQVIDLAVATSFLAVDECVPGLENVVVVFRDITPFKSLERVRRLAVDHLAHELKTPLAVIRASLKILAKHDSLDPKAAKDVQRMARNLDRLSNIQLTVEEILDPPQYEPRPVSVRDVVDSTLEKLRAASDHRSVSLKSDVPDLQTDILDPDIVSLVLNTLVKNGIENTPDGGEVAVEVKSVDEGILFQVRDSGVGIPFADRAFIFEGFHHTQSTDDYSSKIPFAFNAGGKGLELLRLKVLSEMHYFDISFDSARCVNLPTREDHCPGNIAACSHINSLADCARNGGTTFSVLFREQELRETYLEQQEPDSDSPV